MFTVCVTFPVCAGCGVCEVCGVLRYQRSTRGPSSAPSAATASTPPTYQTARNGAAISGQCRLYAVAPIAPASRPTAAPAARGRVGAIRAIARIASANPGSESSTMVAGHTAQVRELIQGAGAAKLSEVTPEKYGWLLSRAEAMADA